MTPDQRWRRITGFAVAVYCLLAILLILQRPGMQYDEALLVLGSVHMRHSPGELTLPHDPDTWLRVFGRWFPLMTVRYVGAIKEYLCLPVFALFGARTVFLRLVSMLLGALGIWGIARLIGDRVSRPAAAVAALLLAVNPSFVDLTVFDNGTVAIWMAALGICCVALSRFLRRESDRSAFWLGVALGLGVWARANFVWLIAAVSIAILAALWKRVLLPLSRWGAMLAGGIVGGFPFLVYQVHSRGGTWEAIGMFSSRESLGQLITARLMMFSEALLSDREHRAIWAGPPMPDWQRWIFPAIVLAACLVCLAIRSKTVSSLWARAVTIAFLLLGAILFSTRMMVSEHHLIVLVPLAAVVVAFAAFTIQERFRWGRIAVAGLALVYLGSAFYWQLSAIQGLRNTGGVGPWSDAVFVLARHLEQKYRDRDIKILDWGLQNNLYVLSDGGIRSREIFADATSERNRSGVPWFEEIRMGGVFLLNGPENRQIPAASIGFLNALAAAKPSVRRFAVKQRSGLTYAEIVEIEPDTAGTPVAKVEGEAGASSSISTGDSRFASQSDGFHQIEESGWRWTKREFSVTLDAPPAGPSGARIVLQLYIPDLVIQRHRTLTLKAKVGAHELAPQTFNRPGAQTFARDLEPGWIQPGPARIEFALDKALPPTAADGRELGVIVSGVSLEVR